MLRTSRMRARALLVLLLSGAGVAHAAGEPPRAEATRSPGKIRVDGVLDEAGWALATPIGPLVQADPKEGASPSEETEVRVLLDDDALYVGVLCRDRAPGAIVSTQLGRDADLEVDDRLVIVLDPFLDRRNGFFFEVNPAGARADGQIANNLQDRDRSWDGIWEARCRRTPEGWVAELAIPWKTLRFRPDRPVWGFNVERQIKRRQEIDRWAGARHDAWISNLSVAGELSGLAGARQGLGLDVRPYASAGEEDGHTKGKAGLDVTLNVVPNVTAVLTANTDFAETEADARQINLTRFPLFLPEKRSFFLEGAGTYDVAGLQTSEPDLVPFFSRRIGLVENGGREVPILAGGKVSGRVGGYNFGLVDVQTRGVDEIGLGPQNMLAARVSRNLFRQSWVGVIATHGDPAGGAGNTLVGADAHLATSLFRGDKNLSLDLFFLHTDDREAGRSANAFGLKLDYPNDLWDVSLKLKEIGEGFHAGLGFVPRTGVRKGSVYAAFQPRPESLGIRQLFFEVEPQVDTDLSGTVLDWKVPVTLVKVQAESGDVVQASWTSAFERLLEPFEVQSGVVLGPGSYRWHRFEGKVETATRRPWVAKLLVSFGGFYDGDLREVQASLTLKPSTHVAITLSGDRNDGTLPAGDFVTQLYSGRLDLNLSPDLSWSSLVQYDSDSRLVGLQSRVRLTWHGGNDVFVVFNRGWLRREDGVLAPLYDRGSVKLQYTIRL